MDLRRSKCLSCGRIDYQEPLRPEPCLKCGSTIWVESPAEPLVTPGIHNIVPDHINKYFDLASGQWINSRSQRKRIYEQMGLSRVSIGEWRRRNGGMEKTSTVTYGGQINNTSSAERTR